MAFQLERAFQEKKVMFAEAGVGTGKQLYIFYMQFVMHVILESQRLSLVQMKR